jgi:hypothetical protein
MTPDQYARFQRCLGVIEGLAVAMDAKAATEAILDQCADLDDLIDEIRGEVKPGEGRSK